MDPNVRLAKPGFCPRCGMKLALKIPERIEYLLDVVQSPSLIHAGDTATLTFTVTDPATRTPVKRFEVVHEKLFHLFLVSENLDFFAHIHPILQDNGTFQIKTRLPLSGMYRILGDYYPAASVPQLSVNTIFVAGPSHAPHLTSSLTPARSANLTAALQMEPALPTAGLETRLTFHLDPAEGLEPYLGVWGHMLVASEDLIDLLHVHPFLANGGSSIQFNVISRDPECIEFGRSFSARGSSTLWCLRFRCRAFNPCRSIEARTAMAQKTQSQCAPEGEWNREIESCRLRAGYTGTARRAALPGRSAK